jgi:DNA-binding transcriptional LysR family regulator
MSLTLDQLTALDAIDRLGSFSAAAKALFRTTSAISYSIRNLEEALGVEIFDRSGHRAILTRAGELILDEARRVLSQTRRLEQLSLELQEGYEPLISIIIDGILPMPPIMWALREFSGKGLSTKVRIGTEYLNGVQSRFTRDDADIMLALDYEGAAELSAMPLPPVYTYLVVHRDHPLAETNASINREILANHVELIVSDSANIPRGATHRLFLGSPHQFEVSDFHSKREALLSNVGFGWLPAHLTSPYLDTGELVQVRFEEGSRHIFEPHMVHRRDPPVGPAARLFMDLLLQAVIETSWESVEE